MVALQCAAHCGAHEAGYTWDFLGALADLHFHSFEENLRDDFLQAVAFLAITMRVAGLTGFELGVLRWSRVTDRVAIVGPSPARPPGGFNAKLKVLTGAAIRRVYVSRSISGDRSVVCHWALRSPRGYNTSLGKSRLLGLTL